MRLTSPRIGPQTAAGTVQERSGTTGSPGVPPVAAVRSVLFALLGEDELFRDPFADFAPSGR